LAYFCALFHKKHGILWAGFEQGGGNCREKQSGGLFFSPQENPSHSASNTRRCVMRNAIHRMTDEIVTILDGELYGLWLYGSVVLEDFRLGWSDIDFIALSRAEISEGQADKLLFLRQELRKEAPESPYYRSFEGILANLDEYRGRSFRRLVYWGTSGQRITDRFAPDPFAEFELANCGRAVYGEQPWPFPAPGREELVDAIRAHYDAIRKYAVQTDERLYSCGWLLDMARCVYTLRYNEVIAKTKAGLWALEEHIFPDEEALKKTVEIRQQPLARKDSEEVKQWLKALGPVVQRYADVLERELARA
jgi:hypothetical protein